MALIAIMTTIMIIITMNYSSRIDAKHPNWVATIRVFVGVARNLRSVTVRRNDQSFVGAAHGREQLIAAPSIESGRSYKTITRRE